jgi:hypothetical protein
MKLVVAGLSILTVSSSMADGIPAIAVLRSYFTAYLAERGVDNRSLRRWPIVWQGWQVWLDLNQRPRDYELKLFY